MRSSINVIKKQKRSFLLMEVLVSITLFAVLFSVLGFWQRHMFCSTKRDEKVYKTFLQENYAYKQLRTIFRATSQIEEVPGALCSVVFDRGVYRDPDLAGEVEGSLYYHKEEGRLELQIRSLRNHGKVETSLLLDNVSQVAIVPRGSDPELPERMQMVIHRHFPKSTERVLTYQFALGK
ncbi:DUF1494 domain-containing protein [Chlamydia psittaci]|nr:DUF1494 domain-containing protein [Chlamydia psittaci]MDS0919522.1 DUF1494 domain-containing protein [Chlamydia psittaci]MDS0989553.1 DUF1494 domain-containing protein [Chlamydia psittaci]MDS0995528.1 DUF1494 domain-containing protein [Chlamydia psittaci]MDS1001212.1 DUF1494 domain-containing protein [Chlamydia psittaci]